MGLPKEGQRGVQALPREWQTVFVGGAQRDRVARRGDAGGVGSGRLARTLGHLRVGDSNSMAGKIRESRPSPHLGGLESAIAPA